MSNDAQMTVFFDDRILKHDTGRGFFETTPSPYLPVVERHPENAERVQNMHGVLADGPIKICIEWRGASPVSEKDMRLFHDDAYLKELALIPVDGERWYTRTTRFGPGSYEIVRISAGLAVAAAQNVWLGNSKIAYALCRPPGHHAQPNRADGYCFLNNIGIAIEVLRANGLKRAAVVDWDVHHGNGTQEGFYALGSRARTLADKLTGGRIVLTQEGGYSLSYAAYCLHASLEGVLGRDNSLDDPIAFLPDHTDGLDLALARIVASRQQALS